MKPFELIFISLFQLLLLIDELARPSSSLFKHLIDSSISHFLMLLHSDFFKPRESGKRSSEAVTSVTLPLKRILLDDSNVSRKTPSHDGQGIDDMSAVDGNVTKSTVENNFQKDTPLPFGILCKTFDLIEGTTKRLEINDHLIDLFLPLIESKSFDLATVVHLCLSRLGPVYRSPELGLGETLLMKAIASCTGSTAARIKSRVEEVGDVGLVAEQSRSTQKVLFQPRPITCASLFKILGEIAAIIGQSSSGKKIDKVSSLYVACRGNEAKYLFRLLEGKLRIGLAEQSILAALAQASLRLFPLPSSSSKYSKYNTSLDGETNADVCRQQAVIILKSVYNCLPDYNILLPALMEFGIWELPNHCHMTPGVPLKPMLAYPTRSIGEVLDRFEGLPFTCEFKYDGERGQVS